MTQPQNITVTALEVRQGDTIVATNARVCWSSHDAASMGSERRVRIHTKTYDFDLAYDAPVNVLRAA